MRVTFIRCTTVGTNDGEGGAVYFASNAQGSGGVAFMNCTSCVFDACHAESGYGAAIFYKSPTKTFVFDDCNVTNMNIADSVIHMQCGDAPDNFGTLSLKNDVFQDITITRGSEGGGSGLVIRFPTNLELIGCEFRRCKTRASGGAVLLTPHNQDTIEKLLFLDCLFSETSATVDGGAIAVTASCQSLEIVGCTFTGKKEVQTGNGGFIMLSVTVTTFRINETTFNYSDAQDGGCIYSSSPSEGTSFIVEGCTVSAAGATTGSYSIVVKAKDTRIKELHMMDMPSGNGRIKLSDTGFANNQITLDSCTFEQFATEMLLSFTTNDPIALTLKDCRFFGVSSTGANLFQMDKDEATGIGNLRISDCIFDQDCSYKWAIVQSQARTGSPVGSCTLERVQFKGLNIQNNEAAFVLKGCESINLVDCNITNEEKSNQLTGVLDIGNIFKRTATFKNVMFSQCEVSNFLISSNDAWTLVMEDCEFVSCKATGAEKNLISGKASQIVQCLFNNCAASSHLLNIQSELAVFELRDVSFVGIVMTGSFIYIRNLGSPAFNNLSMTNCVFSGIEGGTILEYESTTFQIDIQNLTVTGSEFAKLTSMTGAANVENCNFTGNRINGYLFQPMSKLVLSVCHFNDNTGLMVQSSAGGGIEVNDCDFLNMKDISQPMITVENGPVSISGSTFDNCWCTDSPLLLLTSLSLLSVNNSCFQGAAPHQSSASYLTCSASSFTFDMPLCFDLSASESVDFGELDPLQDITAQYRIFECDACGSTITWGPEYSTVETSDLESAITVTSGPESAGDADPGPGAIAGIVIAIIAVIAGVIVLVVLLLRRRDKEETVSDASGMGPETADASTVMTGASTSTADEWTATVSEDDAAFTSSHLADAPFAGLFEEVLT